MAKLTDVCEWKLSAYKGRGHPKRTCGKSAKYIRPDGSEVTVLIYEHSAGWMVSGCCAPNISKRTKASLYANYPDFDSYRPAPEPEPDVVRQQWFRHALSDMGSERQGGLVRADNSDDNLRFLPVQPGIRRVG